MIKPHRTTLGSRFSEGARLVWEGMAARGLTPAALRRSLKRAPDSEDLISSSLLYRVLFGDRPCPGWIQEQFRRMFDVPFEAWVRTPTAEFVPPAARDDDAEESAAAESSLPTA